MQPALRAKIPLLPSLTRTAVSPALVGSHHAHLWRAAWSYVWACRSASSDTPWGILVVEDDLGDAPAAARTSSQYGVQRRGRAQFRHRLRSGPRHPIRFDDCRRQARRRQLSLDLIRLAREQQPGMAVIAMTVGSGPRGRRGVHRSSASPVWSNRWIFRRFSASSPRRSAT